MADMQAASSHPNHENSPRTGAIAPLGIITVIAVIDDEKRRAVIKRRYQLQDAAAIILQGIKNTAGKDIGWRVACCCRHRLNTMAGVSVEVDAAAGRARFGNVMLCERFWMCPVCAARMSERDKHRLIAVSVAAARRGWIPVLLTYTQRHNMGSDLGALLKVNAAARRWHKSGSRFMSYKWSDLKQKFGIVASVINLEITHNDGWHPHNHEIVFIDPAAAAYDGEVGSRHFFSEMRRLISARWRNAVQKYGGDCDLAHGFDLRPGDEAVAEYISKFGHEPLGSKWSIESEMTKAPVKLARLKGRSPFQLLGDYYDGDDRQAGALFREYARHFERKHRLQGLTKTERLLEISDGKESPADAPALETQPAKVDYQPVIELPTNNVAWNMLCRAGKRADFKLAALESFEAALDVLASVGYRGEPPIDRRSQAPAIIPDPGSHKDLPYQMALQDVFVGHGVLDGG